MIYGYCERCGPELLAEPINAASNLAFVIAAWFAWQLAGRAGVRTPGIRLLVLLSVLVGAGSLLLHIFATRWAEFCDVIPIFAFQLSFLWQYSRYSMGFSVASAGSLLTLSLVANFMSLRLPQMFNGSLMYAPTVIWIALLAPYHFLNHMAERWILLLTLVVFSVALFFRTIDPFI